jgi:hypothetical protein
MVSFPSFLPRMTLWIALTLGLIVGALVAQDRVPGSLIAVSLYKAHLMALAGWGGYWLDRALFPYARPDVFMDEFISATNPVSTTAPDGEQLLFSSMLAAAMLRRALVVGACLVCVGLGA